MYVCTFIVISVASACLDGALGFRFSEQSETGSVAARSEQSRARDFSSKEAVAGCRKDGTCVLYDCRNVTIPTPLEVEDLDAKLSGLHEKALPGLVHMGPNEALILQVSMRLAMLAYGRNNGKGLSYQSFRTAGSNDVNLLELQFKSLRHRAGRIDDTAHAVAYLIKVEGGVGVVLCYKGSTNMRDWMANMLTKPVFLFPDRLDETETLVHRGFKAHKERLDERMANASMAPLKAIMTSWGVDTKAETFRSFLLSAEWKFCICVGHSLGGAMSAISALDLAVRTKHLRSEGSQVHAIGIGSAIPGNEGFSESMVTPKGGLRIANEGDSIAFMGFGSVSFSRSTRVVHGYEWILPHTLARQTFKKLKNHIQYDVLDWNTTASRFLFPRVGQTFSSNNLQLGGYVAGDVLSELES